MLAESLGSCFPAPPGELINACKEVADASIPLIAKSARAESASP